MPIPNPVVFVPGITASELRDEYPVDFERVWGVVSKDYERVALHPDDPRYEAKQPSRVVGDRVFRLVYGEFVEELRHNLSPKPNVPVPVFPFGYDWRQPIELTAARLAGFIDEVIARTVLLPQYDKAGYADAPKVNLVGHSMGGLVIAEYLAQARGGHRAAKIATLGSPFRGSHEAVLKVATGTADLGTNRSSSREREMARVTPALYHLIPAYPGAVAADPGLKSDLFDPEAWQPAVLQSIEYYVRLYGRSDGPPRDRARDLFGKMLAQANAQRQRMENLKLADVGLVDDDWLAVVGVGEHTRFRLHIEDDRGKPWFDLASKDRVNTWKPGAWRDQVNTGDGTVPYLGAQAAFLKTDKLVCVCDDDFGYWELKDRLLEGVAAGLHATLPLMNLVQRLVVSHFLGTKFGEVWGRPAPDIGAASWNPPIRKLEMKTK
jgi:pimeloyl-ACP methyl ester carboxylesterase